MIPIIGNTEELTVSPERGYSARVTGYFPGPEEVRLSAACEVRGLAWSIINRSIYCLNEYQAVYTCSVLLGLIIEGSGSSRDEALWDILTFLTEQHGGEFPEWGDNPARSLDQYCKLNGLVWTYTREIALDNALGTVSVCVGTVLEASSELSADSALGPIAEYLEASYASEST